MNTGASTSKVSLTLPTSSVDNTVATEKTAAGEQARPLEKLSQCEFRDTSDPLPSPKQPSTESMRLTSQKMLISSDKAFQAKTTQSLQGLSGGREKSFTEAASQGERESLSSLAIDIADGSAEALDVASTFVPSLAAVGLSVAALKKIHLSNERNNSLTQLLADIDSPQTEAVIKETTQQHNVEKLEALGLMISSLSSTNTAIESGLTIANITAGSAMLAALATMSGVGTAAYGASLFASDQDKANQISRLMPSIIEESSARETLRKANNPESSEVSLASAAEQPQDTASPTPKRPEQKNLNTSDAAAFDDAYQAFFQEYKQLLTASRINSAVMMGASATFALSGVLSLGAALPIATALIGATGFARLSLLEPAMDDRQFKPVTTQWSNIYDMHSRETRVNDHVNLEKLETNLANLKDLSIEEYGRVEKYLMKPLASVLSNLPALKKLPDWSDTYIVNANMRSSQVNKVATFADIQSQQIQAITETVKNMLQDQKSVLSQYNKIDDFAFKDSPESITAEITRIDLLLNKIAQIETENDKLSALLATSDSALKTVENINGHLEVLQLLFLDVLGNTEGTSVESTNDDLFFDAHTETPLEQPETKGSSESSEAVPIANRSPVLSKKEAAQLNKRVIKTIREFEKTATALKTNLYYLQATDDFQLNQAKAQLRTLDASTTTATNQYRLISWLADPQADQNKLPEIIHTENLGALPTLLDSEDALYQTELAAMLSDSEFKTDFANALSSTNAEKATSLRSALGSIQTDVTTEKQSTNERDGTIEATKQKYLMKTINAAEQSASRNAVIAQIKSLSSPQ